MIGTWNLSTETQKITDTLFEAIETSKKDMIKELDSFTKDIYANLCDKFDQHFSSDNSENIKQTIAHEVRHIMSKLLVGDVNTIKDLDIISEYTFDRLHEIRLKIWETCSKDIENCLIVSKQKEIDSLKKDLKFERNRNY